MSDEGSALKTSWNSYGVRIHDDDSTELSHCHQHSQRKDDVTAVARRKLIIGSVLCFLFMAGEVTGGIIANSLAIATDAAHLLSDLVGFSISLVAICLAQRPATKKKNFGFYRAEVLGALLSVFIIWLVTGILIYMAALRCINQDFEIDYAVMLITSGVGIVMNIVLGVNFHHGHGHSHGPKHAHNEEKEPCTTTKPHSHKRFHNVNIRAAVIHVIGDLIQSVGVFVAALVIYFKPEYKLADPICTFFFAVLVMITTITITREIVNVLMEGAPPGIEFSEVHKFLSELPKVKRVHNLRVWALTMNRPALSVHLVIEDYTEGEALLQQCLTLLRHRFDITEVSIQIEQYQHDMNECVQCQDPKD